MITIRISQMFLALVFRVFVLVELQVRSSALSGILQLEAFRGVFLAYFMLTLFASQPPALLSSLCLVVTASLLFPRELMPHSRRTQRER